MKGMYKVTRQVDEDIVMQTYSKLMGQLKGRTEDKVRTALFVDIMSPHYGMNSLADIIQMDIRHGLVNRGII